ncbi:MAG: hypothetical protein CMH62_00320 [Nanoarchaeota archaeon]|nr:hypothetical protein [Nanoarchaeota archaeon]
MKLLTEKTKDVLNLWLKEHSIKEISNITGIANKRINDSYVKRFWKNGYLDRISKGRYILNEKGKEKLNQDINFLKSENLILKLSKNGCTNHEIKNKLKTELNLDLSNSSIFSKIHRFKKSDKIGDRRIKNIDSIKIDKNFYEFLGLILSDGYIGRYEVIFSNKDNSMVSNFEKLIRKWDQNLYQIEGESGAIRSALFSVKLSELVNSFLNDKRYLSEKILNGGFVKQNYFLKGLYSGDGCIAVSLRMRKKIVLIEFFISLAVFNEELTPSIVKLLESKGYNPKFNKTHIRMQKKEDIKRFFKEVKFVKGAKIRKSKYWNGFEKNKLLDYVVNYMQKDNKLRNLRRTTKEKVIEHIKKQLTKM